jgi:2-polyprenyl-6-methoxyphenol hydroxylase-like FAD-dependent oxidoreductase
MAHIGKRAVVVGAGVGGLATARVLADRFDEVLVLERDDLSDEGSPRAGIPQGKHVHVLLAGGHRALSEVFPGFEDELVRAGAVRIQVDVDVLRETARGGLPPRDLGFYSYAISRPRLESTVRRLVRATPNVTIEDRSRVEAVTSSDGGRSVEGVVYTDAGGARRALETDLVVDASGRSQLTLPFLEANGHPVPETTTIGVDMCYSSAIFAIPDDAPTDWKGVFGLPLPPESSRGALMLPIEGDRWILSLGGRVGQEPPGEADAFMDFVANLPFPTIHGAVSHAERLNEVARFRFPESIRRHYERLPIFPRGLLPISDSICRFNPIYGQGMSVAAKEVAALKGLLEARASEPDPLEGLATAFFPLASEVIETPWLVSALPDLAYPDARGVRPPDFAQRLQRSAALNRLSIPDAEIHQVLLEVRHLLRSHTALAEPWVDERLAAFAAQA